MNKEVLKGMNSAYLTLPNFITSLRILGTLTLLGLEPMSASFFLVYTITGVTDVLDGFIARLTGCVSDFGAKLDSVADLLFYSIMVLRFFPVLLETVSGHIWFAIILIVLIRVGLYLGFALKHHALISNHTYLNKLTGALVFCLPFVVNTKGFGVYSVLVCIVAFSAAIYEWVIAFRDVAE